MDERSAAEEGVVYLYAQPGKASRDKVQYVYHR